jgi:hypothetical protein
MAYVQRKIPFVGTPDTNPETKPFFAAAQEGKFMVRRCTACKKVHWYPRALCPFCFGECAWEEGSGKEVRRRMPSPMSRCRKDRRC